MFEQDYLMRLIGDLIAAMRRSIARASGGHDYAGAAEALDTAVGVAGAFDGNTLLSLAPESLAAVMQVSGSDPKLVGFIVRSMHLAGQYYEEAGKAELGALRKAQAHALADAFGDEFDETAIEPDELEQLFDESGFPA